MDKGMSEIVKGVSKMVLPFIMLFGISLVLYGHLNPGGGFSGGVVLTGGFVLLLLAFGKEHAFEFLPRKAAHCLDSLGALGFLSIAILGFTGGYFFYNFLDKGRLFHLWSGGTMILSNIMIGIKIGAALFIGIVTLSMARLVHTKEGVKYRQSEEEDKDV
ncbi:MAG TPA: MnhB domain-containing protein [bacterium]|nr:MnhB domain-containing protein [bacterium]